MSKWISNPRTKQDRDARWALVQKIVRKNDRLSDAATELGITVQHLSQYLRSSENRKRWWVAFKRRKGAMRKCAREQRCKDTKRLRLLYRMLEYNPNVWHGLPPRARQLLLDAGYDPELGLPWAS